MSLKIQNNIFFEKAEKNSPQGRLFLKLFFQSARSAENFQKKYLGDFKMASVNFQKLKDTAGIKAVIRHNDKEERLMHEHSNTDINKDDTHKNIDLVGLSYREKTKRFDERIKQLDETTNTNKRKDRVQAVMINVSVPEGMTLEQSNAFLTDAFKMICGGFKKENIISADIHNDEIHEYYNSRTHENAVSRPHLQIMVIPEVNGKLNAKVFSSRNTFKTLDEALDKMCYKNYEMHFMTGERIKGAPTREMKAQTAKLENENAELTREINVDLKGQAEEARKNAENAQKQVEAQRQEIVENNAIIEQQKKTKIRNENIQKKQVENIDKQGRYLDEVDKYVKNYAQEQTGKDLDEIIAENAKDAENQNNAEQLKKLKKAIKALSPAQQKEVLEKAGLTAKDLEK